MTGSGGRKARASSGTPMSAASGKASRWRAAGRQNRPTTTSPSSIPAGVAASSGLAALGGRPSDPA